VRGLAVMPLVLGALLLASSAAARDPKQPQDRPAPADVARAEAIELVRSDLAKGWKPVPTPKAAPPCGAEPDESKLVRTAEVDPTFAFGNTPVQVGSEVDVFRNAAQAKLDWRLSTLKLMKGCLLQSARLGFGANAKIRVASAVALPPPKLGERSLHYRIVIAVTGAKAVPIVAELIGVGIGRISVVLHAFSVGEPLPAGGLGSLATTLAQRLVRVAGGI
jgi:hypothetical protein